MTIGVTPITADSSWATRGACVSMDPDGFFVQGAEQHAVKAACGACPVRTECLAAALDNRVDFGVWGGMPERERRRRLRRNPDVRDWSEALRRAEKQAVGGGAPGRRKLSDPPVRARACGRDVRARTHRPRPR